MVGDCFLESVLGDSNRWLFIVDIHQSEKGDEEDMDEAHSEVLHHVTTAVCVWSSLLCRHVFLFTLCVVLL
jgi:hypothetical protein